MTRGRLLLVAVSVALVVGVGSGVAAFAMQGGFTGAAPTSTTGTPTIGQTVQCGIGPANRCIPSLHADAVIDAVQSAGFVCDHQPRYSICDHWVSTTAFNLQVTRGSEDDHLIESVIASGGTAADNDVASITLPYLWWVAALPFGDDPAAEPVTAWAQQQIEGGTDARARIGGYEYEFRHQRISAGNRITLEIHTLLGFEDKVWGDGL